MLEVVPVASREWTEEQKAAVVSGWEKTNRTVPFVDSVEGAQNFLILRDDTPIGTFVVIPKSVDACEIGVRFWERSMAAGRLMARGLADLLQHYEYVVARVYASNSMVRRLLQRAGFVLLRVVKQDGRTVHVYGLRRDDFYRLTEDVSWL